MIKDFGVNICVVIGFCYYYAVAEAQIETTVHVVVAMRTQTDV